MIRKIALETISVMFICLFAYAAATKTFEYDRFKLQLQQSPVLTTIAGPVAIAIPGIEIVVAFMLIFHRLRPLGLYLSYFLMVAFTTYIVVILNFSFYVPCSCGGILENMGWTEHLVFNIGFSILGIVGIVLATRPSHLNTASYD